ncbi:MAG: dipeptide epimerase [Tissierellales bacterium]|nr:dipeptide epimerase [Tissierellales bacterium]
MSNYITDVIVHIIEVPLRTEWRISLYAASTRRHAIVEIITSVGIHGYGEASPSPAFMGETADTIKVVVEKYLAPSIIGIPVNEMSTIHEKMNCAIYGNSAAKSAIDIAAHDAWGKSLNQPIYNLIGGANKKQISLSYVVGIKNIDSAYQEALKYINEGYEVIKAKVGNDYHRDIEMVKNVRKAISDSGKVVKLRLDANQGYDTSTAIKLIRELEETGDLESVEQPTRKGNLNGLREIRMKVKTPIMIDETVFGPEDAIAAIRLEIADIINLKICKVGGFYQAKKIANMAESAGLKCTIGSNLELGFGIAASLHLGASTPVVCMPSDFACGIPLHEFDVIEENLLEYISNGQMSLLTKPGLGVTPKKGILFGDDKN